MLSEEQSVPEENNEIKHIAWRGGVQTENS